MKPSPSWLLALAVLSFACEPEATVTRDAGADAGPPDSGPPAAALDAALPPSPGTDAALPDATLPDSAMPKPECEGKACPDLVLAAPAAGAVAHFSSRQIDADDCRLYEGCMRGPGRRSLLDLSFVVQNIGQASLELGKPWTNTLYYESLCQDTYLLDGMFEAVLEKDGKIVASVGLSTACIAAEDGQYTCAAQGLAPDESSAQPRSRCDFLDVTGLAPGPYSLELRVNPKGTLSESNLGNNALRVEVEIPDCDGTMCGGICCPEGIACTDDVCMAPDLRLNEQAARNSLQIQYQGFGEDSCEIEEQCVSGPGRRRLLVFDGWVENWGPGDLLAGEPEGNPLFEYSMCHEHFHFKDVTSYRLLREDGEVAASGHKQSFCLLNMQPVQEVPPSDTDGGVGHEQDGGDGHSHGGPGEGPVRPPPAAGGCNYLAAGWVDIYGAGTPCQWVDITDVPEGDYVLELAVNPVGRIAELATDNNIVRIPYHVDADIPCEPTPEDCHNGVDDDCDGFTDWDEEECRPACENSGYEYCDDGIDNDCDTDVDEACVVTEGGASCEAAIAFARDDDHQELLLDIGTDVDSALSDSCGGGGAAAYLTFTLGAESIVHLSAQLASDESGGGMGEGGGSSGGMIGVGGGATGSNATTGGSSDPDGDAGSAVPDAFDTVLALFAGNCESGTELSCEQGTCGSSDFEQMLRKLPAGTYTVVVRARDPESTGRVRVKYERVDPTNLEIIDEPGFIESTTEGAGDDEAGCGFEGGADRTYLLAACDTTIIASTCGTAAFDSIVDVSVLPPTYPACSEAGYNTCTEDSLGATVSTYAYRGSLVRVSVDSASIDEEGEFGLFVSY